MAQRGGIDPSGLPRHPGTNAVFTAHENACVAGYTNSAANLPMYAFTLYEDGFHLQRFEPE